jgi:hypothetical protein
MFCYNCGNKLQGTEKFCPNCGADVSGYTNADKTTNSTPTQKQTSDEVKPPLGSEVFTSNVLLGGNLVRPDRIIIDERNVIYEKRNKNLIGVDRIIIPIARISSVEIDRKLISTKIIIYSKGKQDIIVENFSVSDGKKIKKAIEERMM